MEWTAQNSKTIAAVLALLLTTSVVGGLYYWDKSGGVAKERDKNALKADSLLSVKLNLERDIHHLSLDLNSARRENAGITKKLASTQTFLAKKNRIVAKLTQETNAQKDDLITLKQQVAELDALRSELKAEIENYQSQKGQWLVDNNQLKTTNEALQVQINDLNGKLNSMVPKSLVTATNFRVDVLKNNHKVTAKAKKANSIMVSFTLPALLTTEGNQQVFLSLTDVENRPLSGAIQQLSVNANETTLAVPVHAVQTLDFGKNPQKAVFEFIPNEKIVNGIYRASIYTENTYLGSVEFQLRDSFLFF
ncbi:hypothetical protein GVN20_16550 [Runella sp. CRIBMP]|uniref:hypothetical protein n=1 Tax=Runella sp. CRIBMP TaxID=2683261 RepID=UPI001411DD3B|nr:hypothetical protein [Runella sp. CRIBMP]NBB20980.1 hypothetical protein [Runella sp. CRIBMP]